ncbi:MAG TPA: thioredoxin domain-containing protein [Polyangiaceae bacterium]|nr:thioredoxin domain-containing protein [Polyangiaceae bacterium]
MRGPDITDDDHFRGAERPRVTLVEYGDYDCPHTRRAQSSVDRLVAENADVRIVFRHFPLRDLHANAEILSRVAEAAALQGRFWAIHDHLMSHRAPIDERGVLADAADAGVDMERVRRDVGLDAVARRIERDVRSGRARGIHSTPSFLFDGVLHDGHYDFETLARKLEDARRTGDTPAKERR